MDRLKQKLLERTKEGNLRKLIVSHNLVDFFSNDYLGLARNKELHTSILHELNDIVGNVNGATGSRLLSGNSEYAMQLEKKLANIFDAEKSLIFNSGYNANLSILSALPQKGDTIIYDELIHASLKEGARLSFAKRFSFKHNDLNELERKLKTAEGDKFVVIESVYSMDGDFSLMEDIVKLAGKYEAYIILDEAHSTGVWGDKGEGLACVKNLHKNIFARIYTFGKGMGVHGACIAGSETLINYLINFARPFIYTTALPVHSLVSINCAFDYLSKNIILREMLYRKIQHFKNCMNKEGINKNILIESESPIQVVKVSGNAKARKLAENLNLKKFDLRPILSPTVKEGEERLRICLHVYNTDDEIEKLVLSLKELL